MGRAVQPSPMATSIFAEAQAKAAANADYAEQGSRAKALAYQSAMEVLALRPAVSQQDGERIEYPPQQAKALLDRVSAWLDRHPAPGHRRTRHANLENFRDEFGGRE